jgi:hypothetical protein
LVARDALADQLEFLVTEDVVDRLNQRAAALTIGITHFKPLPSGIMVRLSIIPHQ